MSGWPQKVTINIEPSGDQTGSTDAANIMQVLGADNIAVLGVGSFYVTAGLVKMTTNQSLVGQGSALTVINVTGIGDGINWHSGAAFDPATGAPSGKVGGFTIQPIAASVNTTNGIHWGDLIFTTFFDIFASGFTGPIAGGYGIGIWGDNLTSSNGSERSMGIQITATNCTIGIAFDAHGGNGSFDYCWWDIHTGVAAGVPNAQTGVAIINGAFITHASFFGVMGNVQGGGSTPPVLIQIGAGSFIANSFLSWRGEAGSTGACTSILTSTPSGRITNCFGLIDMIITNASFIGNIRNNSMIFFGLCAGNALPNRVNAQTGNYTSTYMDNEAVVVFTVSAAATHTLPPAATGPGAVITSSNASASIANISHASLGGTVPATVLLPGTSVRFISDGTNWQAA